MKTKILRNIFLSVGVLFASAQLLPAGTITTIDVPGSTFTAPSAITPGGVIIGSYGDASGVTHGFLRTRSGSFTTIDVPGSTTPTGITPGGIITGWYQGTMGGLDLHGFLRARDGSITSFDAPPGGFIVGSSYTVNGPPPSVNPAGAITGIYRDASFVGHGFLRTRDGTFTTIDFPGATSTEALAINPAGAITGFYCDAVGCHGYVRAPDGSFATFDPPGSTFTFSQALNPAGVATGVFQDASGAVHGFVRIP